MAQHTQLAMIGAGNLGEALLRGIGDNEGAIVVFEKNRARRDYLQREYGIQFCELDELMKRANMLIIAVKPNDINGVFDQLAPYSTPDHVFISVAAGTKLRSCVRDSIALEQLVRVMPNTPAAVSQAVSAIYQPVEDPAILSAVQRVLGHIGDVVVISDEDHFDAITALSGSGPAYICVVLEAMIEGGVKMGLPRVIAQKLAIGTLKGTAALVEANQGNAAAVRYRVTSPGGTTASGLAVLEQRAIRSCFIEAIEAATLRSKELGRES